MVKVENLKKKFGKLEVLNGITTAIPKGKAVAVLGPNGSGKTTLIKCLLGMVIPDSGTMQINGMPVKRHWDYRNSIGYLPQTPRFPENLRVRELISMISDLRRSTKTADELLTKFSLNPFINQSLGNLSGGTRQKVNMIISLMFNPELYIFDEPTVGLDPISRITFKEILLKEKQQGKTIILTTHLMNEVEDIADEIIFLLEGKIHYYGGIQELKTSQQEVTLEKAIARLLITNDSKA